MSLGTGLQKAAGQAADTRAELRSLAVRSTLYISMSLLCYILVWLATVYRPLDLQLDVVSACAARSPMLRSAASVGHIWTHLPIHQ